MQQSEVKCFLICLFYCVSANELRWRAPAADDFYLIYSDQRIRGEKENDRLKFPFSSCISRKKVLMLTSPELLWVFLLIIWSFLSHTDSDTVSMSWKRNNVFVTEADSELLLEHFMLFCWGCSLSSQKVDFNHKRSSLFSTVLLLKKSSSSQWFLSAGPADTLCMFLSSFLSARRAPVFILKAASGRATCRLRLAWLCVLSCKVPQLAWV